MSSTSNLQYSLVGNGDGTEVLFVFVPGGAPLPPVHSTHPNFTQILAGVFAGNDSVVDLFDIAQTVASKFERLTERVTTANGRLYLDGEEINNSLTAQVLRFLREGNDDWKPLVAFYENVQSNPNEHSREQLFSWLDNRDFTITPSGMIVGYKGVQSDGNGGYKSIHSGKAIVNGTVVNGQIPNNVGDILEMPRSEVQFDPSVGCHTGLHVGTFEYAQGFSRGAVLEVHVNPRDVVSVPTDSSAAKVRCCRYTVVRPIQVAYTASIVPDYGYDHIWGDNEDEDTVYCYCDHAEIPDSECDHCDL